MHIANYIKHARYLGFGCSYQTSVRYKMHINHQVARKNKEFSGKVKKT